MHRSMAATLDKAIEQIKANQEDARVRGDFDSPSLADDRFEFAQGLDRTEGVDGLQVEGTFRAPGAAFSIRLIILSTSSCWRIG